MRLKMRKLGIKEEQKSEEEILPPEVELDQSSILPDWKDGDYHDYYGTMEMLNDFNEKYPDLVYVHSIGESVLGRDIWCIRITNEKNNEEKFSCLIDGCIHGCEWEAGEACLYLTEYLLINFDSNKTITNILNTTEVYIIPLVNPDGRQKDNRFNENGIDLNRNFDIDFGRIRGGSIALGKLFNRIKISYLEFPRLDRWIPNFPPYLTNSGRRPFSESETQAIRDFSQTLNKNDFSFYVTCHTAGHCILGPWGAFKPPYEITQHEINIMSSVEEWVNQNTEYTEYRSGEGIVYFTKNIIYYPTPLRYYQKIMKCGWGKENMIVLFIG
jgi:murein tripeptide amidase MpaA